MQSKDKQRIRKISHERGDHNDKYNAIAWNCIGARLAAAAKEIEVWRSRNKGLSSIECVFRGDNQDINDVAWHPSNENVLVSCSWSVKLWDVRTPDVEVSTIGTNEENLCLRWKADGQTIGVVNDRGTLNFIDVESFEVFKSLKLDYAVLDFSWSKTEDMLFISTSIGTIETWTYPGLEKLNSFHSSNCGIDHFSIDTKERYLASGGRDALISFWDVENMACVNTFYDLNLSIQSIAFSHDSKYLAYSSDDKRIVIRNISSGRIYEDINLHGIAERIAWHPSCNKLAYVGDYKDRRDKKTCVTIEELIER